MDRKEIGGHVLRILASQLAIEEKTISEDMKLINDMGCDSLDLVELVMEFEDQFDLNITDERAERAKTVKDIIDGIDEMIR